MRHIISADHHDTFAASGTNPVAGNRDALCTRGTSGVDLRVRPAGTNDLSHLGMSHRQYAEEKLTVESVECCLFFELFTVLSECIE